MSAPDDSTEYPWVAELRKAGIQVRTGTGKLNREPDDSFTPPPGFATDSKVSQARLQRDRPQRLLRSANSANTPVSSRGSATQNLPSQRSSQSRGI